MQWLSARWVQVLVCLVAIETALARLFPDVGYLQTAEKDLEAVEAAAGVPGPKL